VIVEVLARREARSAYIACIGVKYSRGVTGTPADLSSWKKVTNMKKRIRPSHIAVKPVTRHHKSKKT